MRGRNPGGWTRQRTGFVKGLRENLATFDASIANLDMPSFVAVTETWLDKSTDAIDISGYHRVSGLDRREGLRLDRGGVALYAAVGFEDMVVYIADSPVDERS